MPKFLNNLLISFATGNIFVHHGKYFKRLVTQYQPERQKLADAIGMHRNSVYNLYDDDEISWETWYRIANFLKVDVWKELPDMPVPKSVLREDPEFYGTLSLAEALRENAKLKERNTALQEKLQETHEEIIRLQRQILSVSKSPRDIKSAQRPNMRPKRY